MHKRNSSSTRLLTGFIGISPLRLHYGRAANYGSIIIPCACHRHHRKQSGFRCISFIARSHKEGLGAPTSRLRVSPDTSNVLDECLFNFQSTAENWFCPLTSIPQPQRSKTKLKNSKKYKKVFLSIKRAKKIRLSHRSRCNRRKKSPPISRRA